MGQTDQFKTFAKRNGSMLELRNRIFIKLMSMDNPQEGIQTAKLQKLGGRNKNIASTAILKLFEDGYIAHETQTGKDWKRGHKKVWVPGYRARREWQRRKRTGDETFKLRKKSQKTQSTSVKSIISKPEEPKIKRLPSGTPYPEAGRIAFALRTNRVLVYDGERWMPHDLLTAAMSGKETFDPRVHSKGEEVAQ